MLDAKGLSSAELSHGAGVVTLPRREPAQERSLRPALTQTPAWRNLLFTWCNPSPASFTYPAKENRSLQGIIVRALSPTLPWLPLPAPLRLLGDRCVSCDSSSLSCPEFVGKRGTGWGSTWLLSPSGRVAPRLRQGKGAGGGAGRMFTARASLPAFRVCVSALI